MEGAFRGSSIRLPKVDGRSMHPRQPPKDPATIAVSEENLHHLTLDG